MESKDFIRMRIKEEREKQGISQEDFVEELGLGWQRQTLSQIENGEREVKAWELSKIAKVLNIGIGQLLPNETQKEAPYVLWRERPTEFKRIEAQFIHKCKNYKLLEDLLGVEAGISGIPYKKLNLETFTYQDAYSFAEETRESLNLGDYPANMLVQILEDKYGVKFFFDYLDNKGAAVSSRSELGVCIWVNSSDVPWRKNFSIAHELFHILTWNQQLFESILENETLWKKNEKLANAFAAGLLLPAEILKKEIRKLSKENNISDAATIAIARKFGVSLDALLWRMVNLKLISYEIRKQALSDEGLIELDKIERKSDHDQFQFSERFIRLAYLAYEAGNISRSKFSKILSVPLGELSYELAKLGYSEIVNNEFPISNS